MAFRAAHYWPAGQTRSSWPDLIRPHRERFAVTAPCAGRLDCGPCSGWSGCCTRREWLAALAALLAGVVERRLSSRARNRVPANSALVVGRAGQCFSGLCANWVCGDAAGVGESEAGVSRGAFGEGCGEHAGGGATRSDSVIGTHRARLCWRDSFAVLPTTASAGCHQGPGPAYTDSTSSSKRR